MDSSNPYKTLHQSTATQRDTYLGVDVDGNGRAIPTYQPYKPGQSRLSYEAAGSSVKNALCSMEKTSTSGRSPIPLDHNKDLVVKVVPNADFPELRRAPPRLVTLNIPFIVAYTNGLKYIHRNEKEDHLHTIQR